MIFAVKPVQFRDVAMSLLELPVKPLKIVIKFWIEITSAFKPFFQVTPCCHGKPVLSNLSIWATYITVTDGLTDGLGKNKPSKSW